MPLKPSEFDALMEAAEDDLRSVGNQALAQRMRHPQNPAFV